MDDLRVCGATSEALQPHVFVVAGTAATTPVSIGVRVLERVSLEAMRAPRPNNDPLSLNLAITTLGLRVGFSDQVASPADRDDGKPVFGSVTVMMVPLACRVTAVGASFVLRSAHFPQSNSPSYGLSCLQLPVLARLGLRSLRSHEDHCPAVFGAFISLPRLKKHWAAPQGSPTILAVAIEASQCSPIGTKTSDRLRNSCQGTFRACAPKQALIQEGFPFKNRRTLQSVGHVRQYTSGRMA